VDIETKQFWEMGKADEYRKKFGGEARSSSSESVQRIYDEIEKNGDKLKNIIWHESLSHKDVAELKKEGFSVGFENNCYTISW
jgi:hypothetical protein